MGQAFFVAFAIKLWPQQPSALECVLSFSARYAVMQQNAGVPMHDTRDDSMIADIKQFVLLTSHANWLATQLLTDQRSGVCAACQGVACCELEKSTPWPQGTSSKDTALSAE